jgi:hypothetical protein
VEANKPNQIWQSDMTKVWAGPSAGWAYLVCVIECCTREITGWNLSLRCRSEEAIDAVEQSLRVPVVYLGWADLLILRFLPGCGINNLRAFNGVISPIPTQSENNNGDSSFASSEISGNSVYPACTSVRRI